MLTSPRREKKSRDLLGCLGCEGDKARKCSRSLQIPTFCFVVWWCLLDGWCAVLESFLWMYVGEKQKVLLPTHFGAEQSRERRGRTVHHVVDCS